MKRPLLALLIGLGLSSCTAAKEIPPANPILAQALTTARAIDDVYARADALAYIFMAGARIGDESTVEQVEAELIKSVEMMPNVPARDPWLKRIVAVQTGSWIEADRDDETLEGVEAYMETTGTGITNIEVASAELNTVNKAIAVSRFIEDPQERLWALWYIARPAIESGHFSALQKPIIEALNTVKLLSNDVARTKVLAIIAWLQTLSGDRLAAESTFGQATSAIHSNTSDPERAEAFCYLAAARFATGNAPAAKVMAQEALAAAKLTGSPETLRTIAGCQAKIGDTPGALVTVRAIEDDLERATALVQIAAVQAAAGDHDAEKTLREATGLLYAIKTADEYHVTLRKVLQAALNRPDRMRDLLEMIVSMQKHNGWFFWDSSRMAIATAPAIARSIDIMMPTILEIDDPESRLLGLWLLAEPLLLAGDQAALQQLAREALAVIHPAMAAGEQSIGLIDFSQVLAIVALLQAVGGDNAGALATIDEALAFYKGSEYTWMHDNLLRNAAAVRARAGAIALAISTADEIDTPGVRVEALSAIALGGRFLWEVQ